MTQFDFIIDTCVLKDASGEGVGSERGSSARLLDEILQTENHFVAVDKQGGIKREYDNRLGSNSFAKSFLATMGRQQRWMVVEAGNLPKHIRIPLTEGKYRLHSNDHKFVRTSYFDSNGNNIVYREKHWNKRVIGFLKSHNMVCKKACEFFP